eukprot:TRINITY_DN203_c0_g1_i1.p1 TRINITY_DN203_c0_g1~~TRINITY_DN203_c0_g1_i1.p1  ORF type:complete len:101 (-),score=3.95 TRINITY_DN203_c0_g1_i1:420-722(-)
MIRRPPRSTLSSSSAASDVYKRQVSTQSTGCLNWVHVSMKRYLLGHRLLFVLCGALVLVAYAMVIRAGIHTYVIRGNSVTIIDPFSRSVPEQASETAFEN